MTLIVEGVSIPDSKLTREITELVRDTESPLLFNHSSRVFYWGALAGRKRGLKFDAELLYCGCMFHDMGLTHKHSSACERFEVDGANAASDFLGPMQSIRPTSTPSGRQSPCTPLRAFRSTCTPWSPWSPPGWRWTSLV